MKNIFILTHSFPPKNIVGALRPFRLAKHIGRKGWRCVVITKAPDIHNSHDFSLLKELSPNTIIKYLYKPITITNNEIDNFYKIFDENKLKKIEKSLWKYRYFRSIQGNMEILFNKYILTPDIDILHVPNLIKKVYETLDKTDDNLIFTTSPSHSIHLAGYFLSKYQGIPWVADFRDPWDHYTEKGHYDLTNPLERFMESKAIKQADAVISTTETNTKNLLNKHHDLNKNKFYTITNSYDESKVNIPAKKDPEKFIISYTGIFYSEKDPFTFFRALRSWFDVLDDINKKKYKKILQVQLIGSQNRAVEKVINDLRLNDVVRFIDRVPHEEAIRLTKASDMALICSGIGNKTRPGWLLSKLFEYLGCRIPILAVCREGDMANIIRETNSGYVITSENHQAIYSILEKEIEKKISGAKNSDFTFSGVEQFEDKQVMSNMISIIEKTLQNIKQPI